jgi:hypothetical protein
LIYNSRHNLIIGFHGCSEEEQHSLLNQPDKTKASSKPYDWLGHGIYFWENNYDRALEWAQAKQSRGEINKAAVIGAVLSLGYCLDLTDSSFINLLPTYYNLMSFEYGKLNKTLPANKNPKNDTYNDLIIRELDCAVIEFMYQRIDEEIQKDYLAKGYSDYKHFDSTRGLFTEGGPAFPGAGVQKKNHIQICIRNSNCIKGFFLPRKSVKFP